MGKALVSSPTVFRDTVNECQSFLTSLPDAPTWSVIDELNAEAGTSHIFQSVYSQPLCTIIQIALVEQWKFWGLKPNIVVGHSSGEIAAAYAAGIFSLRNAVVVAYYRGYYLSRLTSNLRDGSPRGSMCAIGLSEADCRSILEEYQGQIQLGAVNSPLSCTISGDQDSILSIVEQCKTKGIFCRELRVDTGKSNIMWLIP